VTLQALECPNCGASLEYDGKSSTIRCQQCGSSILVSEPLRPTGYAPDPLVPDPTLTEVAALLREGKRVHATIRYREITGAGLKEAQLAIERFLAGEPLQRPNQLG